MVTASRGRLLLATVLGLASLMLLADGGWSRAMGCDGGYGYWGYDSYGWGTGYYSQDTVPYYVMHPPVYYSYVVPRPYGYSPFPYPIGSPTPEVAVAEPKIIRNPYVPAPAGGGTKSARMTPQPLRIRNPYVAQASEGKPAAVEASLLRGTRPQVIYPARMSRPL